jgi:hypothetical protein
MEYLAASGWLDGVSTKQRDAVLKKYRAVFEQKLAEVVALLGPPDQPDGSDLPAVADWYPEAIRAACWRRGNKTLCLALEQHDKETPLGVVLRCLSDEEIDELSA